MVAGEDAATRRRAAVEMGAIVVAEISAATMESARGSTACS
jgi:hypothetical protein